MIQKALVLAVLMFAHAKSGYSTAYVKTADCSNEYHREIKVCPGSTYLFAGQFLSIEGLYTHTFTDLNGCDSIVNLQFWFLPTSTYEFQTYLCQGQSLNYSGYLIDAPGVYNLHYTASWGCDSTVIVHVIQLPAYVGNVEKTLCEGDSIFFGTRWISEAGDYQALFARNGGCDSVVNLKLNITQTRVAINKESDGLMVAVPMDAYQWMVCPTFYPIPNANNRKLPVTSQGTYALRVENKGCVDTLDCIFFDRNATAVEKAPSWNMRVYPNPARDFVNVYGEYSEEALVEMYGMDGQRVYTGKALPEQKLEIPTTDLKSGIYILRVTVGRSLKTFKISIE